MDVMISSASRGWNVLTSLLLEWVQVVDPVLRGSLETQTDAMVCDTKKIHIFNTCLFSIDIDECAQDSTICSQICVNTRGSYYCSCSDGFQLTEGTNQCEGMSLHVYTLPKLLFPMEEKW